MHHSKVQKRYPLGKHEYNNGKGWAIPNPRSPHDSRFAGTTVQPTVKATTQIAEVHGKTR